MRINQSGVANFLYLKVTDNGYQGAINIPLLTLSSL
jgi:hypothetical protein